MDEPQRYRDSRPSRFSPDREVLSYNDHERGILGRGSDRIPYDSGYGDYGPSRDYERRHSSHSSRRYDSGTVCSIHIILGDL